MFGIINIRHQRHPDASSTNGILKILDTSIKRYSKTLLKFITLQQGLTIPSANYIYEPSYNLTLLVPHTGSSLLSSR